MSRVSDYEVRREYILGMAVRAGKFDEARAAYWRTEYDRDPSGTESAIDLMAAGCVVAAATDAPASNEPYPRDLFPELARAGRWGREQRVPAGLPASAPPATAVATPAVAAHVRPTVPPDEGEISRELVAAWSRALFPEAAMEGAPPARITKANDG